MFRKGEASTEVDRKPFLFSAAAFACCLTAAVLLFVFGGDALSIFAGILLSIVAIAAGAVLLAMVTDRAYVCDDVLYMSYLFRRKQIPLSEIGKVALKDEVYSIYDRKGRLAGTINARLTGIGTVLYALDQQKVPFV